MKPLGLSYIGGFFDGEGSICIGRRGRKDYRWLQLTVSLTNTNLAILVAIRHEIGQGCVLKEKDSGQKNRERLKLLAMSSKPCFELVWTGKQAELVLKKLVRHLKIKKGEAEIALRYRATYPVKWSRHPNEAVMCQREALRAELRVVRGSR